MRRYSVFLWVLLILPIFLVSNASAYEYGVIKDDNITLLNGGNGINGGGAFNWEADDGYHFASFCLEKNEYITPGNTYAIEDITNGATAGGIGGPNPDPISNETAWLFWNFSQGTLAGYNSSSSTMQAGLQNLIWEGEEEISSYSLLNRSNSLLGFYELDWFFAAQDAVADGWNNNDGKVAVLNLKHYVDLEESGYWENSQDQLIAAAPVPEPGTMVLLGMGLLFIAGVSRKKLKS